MSFRECTVHQHTSQAEAEDCALRAIADRTRSRMTQERRPARLSKLVWPVLIRLTASQLKRESAMAMTSSAGGREGSGNVG